MVVEEAVVVNKVDMSNLQAEKQKWMTKKNLVLTSARAREYVHIHERADTLHRPRYKTPPSFWVVRVVKPNI